MRTPGQDAHAQIKRPSTHVRWDVTKVPTFLGATLENLTQASKDPSIPANRVL